MCNSNETILVKGGYTGKKLHKGLLGSSVLSCGHWTKADLRHFKVADDVSAETIAEFKAKGFSFCEKCFPEMAEEKTAEEKPAYTGPKLHMKRLTPRINEDNKVVLRVWQGSNCGDRSAWNMVGFKDFKEAVANEPERVCKRCAKALEELQDRVNTMIELRDSRA